MAFFVWIISGLLGAYELGRSLTGLGGPALSLVLTGILALGGAVALLIVVSRSIRDRDIYAGILLVSTCFVGAIVSAWGADKWGEASLNKFGYAVNLYRSVCDGLIFYFLTSLLISGSGLLFTWLRPPVDDAPRPFTSLGLEPGHNAFFTVLGIAEGIIFIAILFTQLLFLK